MTLLQISHSKAFVVALLLLLTFGEAFVVPRNNKNSRSSCNNKPPVRMHPNGADIIANTAEPQWWEKTRPPSHPYTHHHQQQPEAPSSYARRHQPEASSYARHLHPASRTTQTTTIEPPPKVVTTTLREQQLELQIQDLQAQLSRAKKATNTKHQEQQQQRQTFLTLLEVCDNLHRALQAVPQRQEEKTNHDHPLQSLLNGVLLTKQGLDSVLEMNGIVPYGAIGESFDHTIHHAVCEYTDNSDSKQADNTIGAVVQAGYLLHDTVLRCAQVAVIKSDPSPEEECALGE